MNGGQITSIRSRDGSFMPFDAGRIERAIARAIAATGGAAEPLADKLASQVVGQLESQFPGGTPDVEQIQDIVEEVLMASPCKEAARAYMDYRRGRSEIRSAREFLGVRDDLKLPLNALTVLKKRYLAKDGQGHVTETPGELFRRVAKHVAAPESTYGDDPATAEEQFFTVMASREFLPNSPTLMNAGTELGLLSACFVLPVPDSIPGIFDSVKYMAIIHQAGGGTGFSFTHLRPKGDLVGTTHGVASGPVSFMGAFDSATDVVKQGGRRRGANMGTLRVDHPDILEFIGAKSGSERLANFNISVAATDEFMEAVRVDGEYALVNPRTGDVAGRLRAQSVMEAIASSAWASGDPGMIFIDRINKVNPTPALGPMETTNPCGEQPLLPYESCNLGSIDLSKLVIQGGASHACGGTADAGAASDGSPRIDWERLGALVDIAVHFLDNVIDANRFPLAQIKAMTDGNRKIGLGVMGFAEALLRLGIRYDSDEALVKAEEIMKFIQERAVARSAEIARRRGSFPNFEGSLWQKRGYAQMRNATVTTIAPTGTISVISGTSSGIEPLFAISFIRDVMEGTQMLEVSSDFERVARQRGFYSEGLMMEISRTGSVRGNMAVPEDVRDLFVTAMDIDAEWHVRMQAAFQKHVDNAVSKTVNMPQQAGIDDVRRVFLLAWDLGCKGITVFRYGSRRQQVLYLGGTAGDETDNGGGHVRAGPEFAGGCPVVDCEI
ncbi:MAG: adenosylcobalamin-dependent ribonucleoside-diphosphate reductase [Thermoleophilia bacterium]|nr:adenosylcobalamin-dependent ribonucleoside-diphosphate reductase [Thermoleophilia bacterium]